MPTIRTAITVIRVARRVLAHPVTQAGLAAAPLLLSEPVKARARAAALKAAFKAGELSRLAVDRLRDGRG